MPAWAARLEERQKAMAESAVRVERSVDKFIEKTDVRMTRLEEWRNRTVGAIILLGLLIGWAIEFRR